MSLLIEDEDRLKKVHTDFIHDFKEAKKAKKEIDDLIVDWNDLYYGITRNKYGEPIRSSDGTNKSRIEMREVAKHIELQKPNLTQPFLSSLAPIRVVHPLNETRSRNTARWLNHVFTSEYDRNHGVNQAVDIFLREGTVWVHTPWITETVEVEDRTPAMDIEQLAQQVPEGAEIVQEEDELFSAITNTVKSTTNRPDIEITANEDAFPDPSATSVPELLFFARRRTMTITEIKELEDLETGAVSSLKEKMAEGSAESSLANQRKDDLRSYGRGKYQSNDRARTQIDVIEYWGYYDIKENGSLTPVLALWDEQDEILISLTENPMPHGRIPFHNAVYSPRAFSLWGNAPAFFIGDNQKVKTGIMRGIIDNMSLANNGQKFVLRGALNYVNMKRMREGNRIIEINRQNGIEDGQYNQLPQSVFSVMEMMDKENIDLMGVNPGGAGLTAKEFNSAESNSMLTMSQQRMISSVEVLGNLYAKCFKDWIEMGHVFMDDEQLEEMFIEDEQVDYNSLMIGASAHVSMMVGTSASKNLKLHQLNMLMQQSKTLESSAPPGLINDLVAEMFDSFEMYEKSDELRNYKPEPTEEQQMMSSLAIQKEQLEVAKLQKEVETMDMNVRAGFINAEARMAEVQFNMQNTAAKTEHEQAKTQALKVKTALDPVRAESELGEREARTMQALTEKDQTGETKQRT